jgi:Ran GTPase-activating protein (RanGAP) involved in mRNA processing and transport
VRGGFPTGLLDCTRLRRLCLSNAGDAAFPALPPGLSQLQDLDHLILYDCGVAQVRRTIGPDTSEI